MAELSVHSGNTPQPQKTGALSPALSSLFQERVVQKIASDPRTLSALLDLQTKHPGVDVRWFHVPLGVPFGEVRESVLCKGRADFTTDEPAFKLSVEDKVLLYAYSNMRRHIGTLLHVFGKHDHLVRHTLFGSVGATVIDFGCGPFTGALGIADFLSSGGAPAQFQYRGVDLSRPMLELGKTLLVGAIERKMLFGCQGWRASTDHSTFPHAEPTSWLPQDGSPVVFLFSHLFASESLDPGALSFWVNQIVDRLPNIPMAIVMTNSSHELSKGKWRTFQSGLSGFSVISSAETERFPFNGDQKLTECSYAILGRHLPGQIIAEPPRSLEDLGQRLRRTNGGA